MPQTALHPWVASSETSIGPYHGVETALHFGNAAQELAALRTGCGLFSLEWRSRINVTGKDRVRWLHNMVTNNVRELQVNRGNYNFVLNAQGRILGDIYIYNRGESFVLATESTQVEPLLGTMKRFIIMDKVELLAAGETTSVLGVCGPKAQEVLAACGIDLRGMEPLELRDQSIAGTDLTLVSGSLQMPGWFEFWVNMDKIAELWTLLVHAGVQPVGAEALEMWRVLRGIPCYGQDIRDRDLPQETEQTQALNFTKGCYIGQEIVERIRSRGQVHRKFTGFEFGSQVPASGKYECDGRVLAEITTLSRVPTQNGTLNLGLGYVRREAVPENRQIDLNGNRAKVVDLPFEI